MGARSGWLYCGSWVVALVLSATAARAYTDNEQQMCTGDAFRLCGSDIPDVDRVTACMVRQRALLSPGCRAFIRETPSALTPVSVDKPVVVAPRALRKAKKPRRSK